MTSLRLQYFVSLSLIGALLIPSFPLHAEEEIVEGRGAITITQEHDTDDATLGSWTLIRPDNSTLELDDKPLYTDDDARSGKYTLIIDKPDGTSSVVELYHNGELISSDETPQVVFNLSKDDNVVILAKYTFTRTGTVGVTSTPPGIDFELTGPDGLRNTGVTPVSYQGVPEGRYSVKFIPIEECGKPRQQSDQLIEDGRISFQIQFECDAMDELLSDEYEKQLKYVTVKEDGKDIAFTDVPLTDWFATFVNTVARTGIMSGYKNSAGTLSGRFGPSDPVNLAQLVKVAHELAGIDESNARGAANNSKAQNTWFEQYWRSAELHSWLVYRDPWVEPGRQATRGEVIATLLQALDVPRYWPKGDIFSDVSGGTAYSASIETAARDGIISGVEEAASGQRVDFRPHDPINRAELAKILSLAIGTYIEDSPEVTRGSY